MIDTDALSVDEGVAEKSGYDAFFSRVLPIFGLMLALTGGTILSLLSLNVSIPYNIVTILGALVIQIVVYIAAGVFRKAYPFNVAFAIVFAVVEGVIATPVFGAILDAGFAGIIGQALVITSVVFVGAVAYPLISGKDFRYLRTTLFFALLAVLALSLVEVLFGFPSLISLLVSLGTVILFIGFILYDVSSILEEEQGAVFGAISLYLDFIIIFYEVLEILLILAGED